MAVNDNQIAKVGNTEKLVMLMHGLHPLFFCRSKMMKERNTTQEFFSVTGELNEGLLALHLGVRTLWI